MSDYELNVNATMAAIETSSANAIRTVAQRTVSDESLIHKAERIIKAHRSLGRALMRYEHSLSTVIGDTEYSDYAENWNRQNKC